MPKKKGRELLIKIRMSTGPDVFNTLCGLNSKTVTINNNEVDVTTPDCADPGGIMWTEVMSGAKRFNFSGNGFFEDSLAEAKLLEIAMLAEPSAVLQVIWPDFGTFQGAFFLSSVEGGGESEGGVSYSFSAASTGPVTFTAA